MKRKVLFFGLGSIGRRHAKLLLENFNVEIAAFRTGSEKSGLEIREFKSLRNAFTFNADIAFITNPTNLHVNTALECAKRSINIFIEKPLSNKKDSIDELVRVVEKDDIYNYVAFCMRFHPVIKYLVENVERDDIFYARTIYSSYFPLWRPGQDYRKSYSANSETGGGVLNELIHELDYNQLLFGKVKKITGSINRTSSLEIASEDYSELHMKHESGITSHVSLDFFSHLKERSIRIYTPDEVIVGDILNHQIKTFRNYQLVEEVNVEPEDIYLNQLTYFFENIKDKDSKIMSTVKESRNLVYKISEFKNNY